MNKKKIIFSGGGTLGHIVPIIPIVMLLYKEYDLYFIGTKKGREEKYIYENKLNIYFKGLYFFDMVGINRKDLYKNITTFKKYFKVKKQIKQLYNKLKPNLIIGMGGYISGVAINEGIKKNIKTIIHEQNAILGLSNKLVYKKVNKVLLTIPIDNLNINNKIVIGNPRYSYVLKNYKSKEENIILICGGSLGSKFINDLIINNYEQFIFEDYILKIVVGDKYYNENINNINKIKTNKIIICKFINNLVDEMSKATLIISRCGASTLSEIMALKKPSILIPSPNVTNNHQLLNGLYLENNGCCDLIEEKNVTLNELKKRINNIIYNYNYKQNIVKNIKSFFVNDPTIDFVNIIKELI